MPLDRSTKPRPTAPALLLACALAPPAAAQLDMLQPPPSLPSLPQPPAIQHALLENPIPLVIGALALGLGAYALASRLGKRRLGVLSGLGAFALGLVAVGVSLAVETNRERVIERTTRLVAAVAAADLPALDRLLDSEVRLVLPGAGAGRTKADIMAWVERSLSPSSPYALQEHRVNEVQAEINRGERTGSTRALVTLTPANQGLPSRFVCMLDWRKDAAGDWLVVDIEPLWLQGWGEITANDLRRNGWR